MKSEKKQIPVYSEMYRIHGTIVDYGVVTKLVFNYADKDYEIGIKLNPFMNQDYEQKGQQIMDSVVSNLFSTDRKVMLHNWYIDENESEKHGKYAVAHGIVTGHRRLPDSEMCHTSRIRETYINGDELVVLTLNTEYHCPLNFCKWRKQDQYPELVPDYKKIKETYMGKEVSPTIEPGKVLLVLANYCEYYFHSLYFVPEGKNKPCEYCGSAHVGMFQDSFLIEDEMHTIDLRYFPHWQNIEFYMQDTNGMPLFIENIGDSVLYAKTSVGTLKLEPGDRKEVTKENAESETPELPNGDLYPAGIIE